MMVASVLRKTGHNGDLLWGQGSGHVRIPTQFWQLADPSRDCCLHQRCQKRSLPGGLPEPEGESTCVDSGAFRKHCSLLCLLVQLCSIGCLLERVSLHTKPQVPFVGQLLSVVHCHIRECQLLPLVLRGQLFILKNSLKLQLC